MNYTGFVRGFAGYTPQQLEKMKSDLGLTMPLSMLALCASYFGKQEKRDPAIEELGLFDLLFQRLSEDPTLLAPTELMTNDACVARTYADLMQKRNALYPNVKSPCSLKEASRLATTYLLRAGKAASLNNRSALLLSYEDCGFCTLDDRTLSVDGSHVALRQLKRKAAEPQIKDAILLLLPSSTPEGSYDAAITRLLNDPTLTEPIKQLRQIGRSGLLYELMQLCDGATVSMPHMARLGEAMPLSMLVNSYEGKYILRTAADDAEALERAFAPLGLRVMRFAFAEGDYRMTVIQEDGRRFSWSIDFLRALLPIRPVAVRLANESVTADAPICHLPSTAERCKYLMHPPVRSTDTYFDGEVLTSVAAVVPQRDFFRNALDTALTAVTTLSVAGCHYSEQRLAISLTLPQKPSDAEGTGEGVSTVLGLYRLQAELGIPLVADRSESTPVGTHPSLTVFAMANGTPCPISLQNEGDRIYCIMPRLDGDGSYNFRELRNLLSYLSEQRNRGVLKSARVLCRESVTDALAQMRTDALSCRLLSDVWASDGALPLAILLESSEPIANAKEVARVVKRTVIESVGEEATLPSTALLIGAKQPTVAVVARRSDTDAAKLCKLLRLRGARVREVTLSQGTKEDRLAQSIFGVQTLILCAGVELPHTPMIDFALETLHRAGGRLLLPRRVSASELPNAIVLPDGLSNKMLDQICFLQK